MRGGPSLQLTTALSAALHATFFMAAMIVMKNSNHMLMPSPYVVTLVSPGGRPEAPVATEVRQEAAAPAVKAAEPAKKIESKSMREPVPETKRIEDKISELASKKRIERIVKIRNEMLSISAGDKGASAVRKTGAAASRGTAGGPGAELTYADRIRAEIHKQWYFPDTMDKKLEMVLSIKIQKDGTIVPLEIEKKSGNPMFDKLALKAIEKASPVSPPPGDGIEFGIRFTP